MDLRVGVNMEMPSKADRSYSAETVSKKIIKSKLITRFGKVAAKTMKQLSDSGGLAECFSLSACESCECFLVKRQQSLEPWSLLMPKKRFEAGKLVLV
jgi:hypothetical protein